MSTPLTGNRMEANQRRCRPRGYCVFTWRLSLALYSRHCSPQLDHSLVKLLHFANCCCQTVYFGQVCSRSPACSGFLFLKMYIYFSFRAKMLQSKRWPLSLWQSASNKCFLKISQRRQKVNTAYVTQYASDDNWAIPMTSEKTLPAQGNHEMC